MWTVSSRRHVCISCQICLSNLSVFPWQEIDGQPIFFAALPLATLDFLGSHPELKFLSKCIKLTGKQTSFFQLLHYTPLKLLTAQRLKYWNEERNIIDIRKSLFDLNPLLLHSRSVTITEMLAFFTRLISAIFIQGVAGDSRCYFNLRTATQRCPR